MSCVLCSSITDASPVAILSFPTSVSEVDGPTHRGKFDFTGFNQVSITSYISSSVTSSFTGSISYQWSRDQTTWNWFNALAGVPSIGCNVVGAINSGWAAITGSLTGSASDVWIRPVTRNGDGLSTVYFNSLTLTAR